MTEEEILKGNEKIAKYMGHLPSCQYFGYPEKTVYQKYHDSWDLLIPVVHKICLEIDDDRPSYTGPLPFEEMSAKKIRTAHLNNTIMSIFGCVLEYINWHSEWRTPTLA